MTHEAALQLLWGQSWGGEENGAEQAPRRIRTREVESSERRIAMRKMDRLMRFIEASPSSAPVIRKLERAIDAVDLPEQRVEAAMRVLKAEVAAGRESDLVRACLASLRYKDELDLEA